MKKIINTIILITSIMAAIYCVIYCINIIDMSIGFYSLFYDISVGFLLSAIFYFLVEFLPGMIKLHKAIKIVQEHINKVVIDMEKIISIVIQKYNINSNLKELSSKDFILLNGDTKGPAENIYYKTTIIMKKNKINIDGYDSLKNILKSSLIDIQKEIEEIMKFEVLYSSDSSFVECIRKIGTCNLNNYINYKGPVTIYDFFIDGSSNDYFYNFVTLYNELSKFKYNSKKSITKIGTEEETNKYLEQRKHIKTYEEVVNDHKRHILKDLENLTGAICFDSNNARLIHHIMKDQVGVFFPDDNEIKKGYLSICKNLIIFVNKDNRKVIIDKFSKEKINQNLLFITEKKILKRGVSKYVRNNNSVVGEIFYSVSFKIRPFNHVFKKNQPSEKTIWNVISEIRKILFNK